MKKEFLILLVQTYLDVIKVTMNITVARPTCTMLTLFKPWRRGRDLKESVQNSWDNTFNEHEFRNREVQLMKIFNIRYECLDARDDFHAQLKNGFDKSLIGSWEVFDDENVQEMESFQRTTENEVMYDDIPVDPKAHGKNFLL